MKLFTAFLLMALSIPVIAEERVHTKFLENWAITHDGQIILDNRKANESHVATLSCPVNVNTIDKPSLKIVAQSIAEDTTVYLAENVQCKVGKLQKIEADLEADAEIAWTLVSIL